MKYLREDILEKKDAKAALETPSHFTDMNGKHHHVIELDKYYNGSGKKAAADSKTPPGNSI